MANILDCTWVKCGHEPAIIGGNTGHCMEDVCPNNLQECPEHRLDVTNW